MIYVFVFDHHSLASFISIFSIFPPLLKITKQTLTLAVCVSIYLTKSIIILSFCVRQSIRNLNEISLSYANVSKVSPATLVHGMHHSSIPHSKAMAHIVMVHHATSWHAHIHIHVVHVHTVVEAAIVALAVHHLVLVHHRLMILELLVVLHHHWISKVLLMHRRLARNWHTLLDHFLLNLSLCLLFVLSVSCFFLGEHRLGLLFISMPIGISLGSIALSTLHASLHTTLHTTSSRAAAHHRTPSSHHPPCHICHTSQPTEFYFRFHLSKFILRIFF